MAKSAEVFDSCAAAGHMYKVLTSASFCLGKILKLIKGFCDLFCLYGQGLSYEAAFPCMDFVFGNKSGFFMFFTEFLKLFLFLQPFLKY